MPTLRRPKASRRVVAAKPSPETIARIVERWFAANARDLPWRRRPTRWRRLVSEIMLQQTQVARVEERYGAFVHRFPTPAALASADPDEVASLWAGLGYYRRVRHLQAAAVVIVETHGGRVPASQDALLALPGVGRYTAGAMASIACGQVAAIVDGNVHRVIARLFNDPRPLDDAAASARTWARSLSLVQAATSPGAFNEGLMEFGATICTPSTPACGVCPLRSGCAAFKAGTVGQTPRPRQRPGKRVLHHHAVAIIRRGQVAIEQRTGRDLWSGLWQLPTVEHGSGLGPGEVRRRLGVSVEPLRRAGGFERLLTHRRVLFQVFRTSLQQGARLPAGMVWASINDGRGRPPMGRAQEMTMHVVGESAGV